MSHIVEIKTEVRDATAVRSACQRLKLPVPVHGKTRLFSGEVSGLAVQLPGWKYPVVAQLDTGQLRYDTSHAPRMSSPTPRDAGWWILSLSAVLFWGRIPIAARRWLRK